MAEHVNPETIPPVDPVAFGTDCAVTIRALLPAAMAGGLCPWRLAGIVALMKGHPGAVLAAGNALRWQCAHDFARMGRRDLARAMIARELTIEGGAE